MKKKAKIAFGKLNLLRNDQLNNKNKIKIGFVGGGPNSFIGYTHRLAARFDNRFEFVAGVFSKDKKKSKEFGRSLGLDSDRCYNDYKIMAKQELARHDGVQAIGIMTPSGDHYKIAKEFIKNNVHIICDKPLTSKVEDAVALEKLVHKTKIVFALTHNYSGYPMLREAKKLVEGLYPKEGKVDFVKCQLSIKKDQFTNWYKKKLENKED